MRARASKTRSSYWVLENDCRQWFQPSQCLASFCLLKTCYQVRFRSMYKYQVSVAGLTKINMHGSEKDKDRSYRRAFVYISTFFFFLQFLHFHIFHLFFQILECEAFQICCLLLNLQTSEMFPAFFSCFSCFSKKKKKMKICKKLFDKNVSRHRRRAAKESSSPWVIRKSFLSDAPPGGIQTDWAGT